MKPESPAMDERAVEAVALAMCDGNWNARNFCETPNGEEPEEHREYWRGKARLAIAAYEAAKPSRRTTMIDEKGLDEIVKAAWRKARGPRVGASDGQTYVVPTLTNDLMRDICRAAIAAYLSASAEPVAWRFRIGAQNLWSYCDDESDADFYIKQSGRREVTKQPLYAHPKEAPNV